MMMMWRTKALLLLAVTCCCGGLAVEQSTAVEVGKTHVHKRTDLLHAFEPYVSRLVFGVLEANRRKAPCVCAGMCREAGEHGESECQACEMFMGHFNQIIDHAVAPEENSGVFRAVAQKLAMFDDKQIVGLTSVATKMACKSANAEFERLSCDSETCPEESAFQHAFPTEAKKTYKHTLSKVVHICKDEGFQKRVGCIGGFQFLKIMRSVFPAAEPVWDNGELLSRITKKFLTRLGAKKLKHTQLTNAVQNMGEAPRFVNARKTLNTILCEISSIEKDCGLMTGALLKDAAHRKFPLLAPMYMDLHRELGTWAHHLAASSINNLEQEQEQNSEPNTEQNNYLSAQRRFEETVMSKAKELYDEYATYENVCAATGWVAGQAQEMAVDWAAGQLGMDAPASLDDDDSNPYQTGGTIDGVGYGQGAYHPDMEY